MSTIGTTSLTASASGTSSVELAIGGMTCASCAARIEKKLNKIDGVTANVNFAMESAKVHFPPTVSLDQLIRSVEDAGYTAVLPTFSAAPQPGSAEPVSGAD